MCLQVLKLLNFYMNEIPLETQIIIGIITFIVFYFLLKQTIKNISSTNDDGDTIINLEKLNKRNGDKKG
tara:strand:- start:253 stop:459 length:207 start_codon:yes stop_codon:yes gene_type:complete